MLCTSFLQLFVIFSRQPLSKNPKFHHANALEFSGVAKAKRRISAGVFRNICSEKTGRTTRQRGFRGGTGPPRLVLPGSAAFDPLDRRNGGSPLIRRSVTGEKVAGGRPRRFRMARLSGLAFVRRSSDRFAKAGKARTPLNRGPSGPKGRGVMAVGFRAGIFGSCNRGRSGCHSKRRSARSGRLLREVRRPVITGSSERVWAADRSGRTRNGSDLRVRVREGVSSKWVSARFGVTLAERQRSFPGSSFLGTEICWEERFRRRHNAEPSGFAALPATGSDLSGRGGNAGESGFVHVGRIVRTTATRPRFVSANRGQGRNEGLRAGPFNLVTGRCRVSQDLRVFAFPDRSGFPVPAGRSETGRCVRRPGGVSASLRGVAGETRVREPASGFSGGADKRPATWFDRSRSTVPSGAVGCTGSIGPRCFARVTGMPIEKV